MDLEDHPQLLIEAGTFVKLSWHRSRFMAMPTAIRPWTSSWSSSGAMASPGTPAPVVSREGVEVEPGALRLVRARDCVLADQDEWATMPADHPAFERVE